MELGNRELVHLVNSASVDLREFVVVVFPWEEVSIDPNLEGLHPKMDCVSETRQVKRGYSQ